MRNAVALELKVGEQRRTLLGHAEEHIDQGVDVLDEDCREVTHQRAFHIIVRRMAAAEDERLAVEEAAVGVVAQIESHHVGSAFIVDIMKAGAGHRNELRLVIRRARRLGIPSDKPRPQHIGLAVAHAVDVAFQFLIRIDGYVLGKVVVAFDILKRMGTPILRITAFVDEIRQRVCL